jgi:hypothetical protein
LIEVLAAIVESVALILERGLANSCAWRIIIANWVEVLDCGERATFVHRPRASVMVFVVIECVGSIKIHRNTICGPGQHLGWNKEKDFGENWKIAGVDPTSQ